MRSRQRHVGITRACERHVRSRQRHVGITRACERHVRSLQRHVGPTSASRERHTEYVRKPRRASGRTSCTQSMATNSDLFGALERAAGHSLMGSVKGACHAHAPRASVSCERHVASRKRHLVPKASRERHLSVTRPSCERHMPGEWHLPGRRGVTFAKESLGSPQSWAWAEKIRAARSASIVARRFTKN